MSAEIDPLESKADADNNMEEAAAGVEGLTVAESDESDAADFLLYNSKYHDCFLTVGNPETDKVESIGVATIYLVAKSPVFRKMLGSYKQAYLPNDKVIVSDVSPTTFKLMLRYLYEGELPKMTAIETAGLALCADKYKISRLIQETLKRLNPTSAEDVFPALICVTYTKFPDLEVQVSKIIQQETHKVVQSADFLQLDEACLLFILKQNVLDIDEVELWKHVVRWAEHQVEINPARTVRDCLAKILGYVRFLTFTSEEILDHVLPTEVITPEEFVDLVLAVRKKQLLKSTLLCNVRDQRGIYQEEEVNAQSTLDKTEDEMEDNVSVCQNKSETIKLIKKKPKSIVFNKSRVFRVIDYIHNGGFKYTMYYNKFSSLTLIPNESIEIVSFKCRSQNGQPNKKYEYVCDITITKSEKNFVKFKQVVCVKDSALYNGIIVLPLKFDSGKPIVMNPGEEWKFDLEWNLMHSAFDIKASDDTWGEIDVTFQPILCEDMIVIYHNSLHVFSVAYKKQ